MQKQKKYRAKIIAIVSIIFFPVLALAQTAGGGWSPSNYGSTGLPQTPIITIVENVMKWLLFIFGFVAIIGFVISGIMYLASAGDEDRQEQAKRAMYYSITGVIVGLVGLIVVYAADALLRGYQSF